MTIQFNTAHCKRKPAVHNIYSLDSIKNIYIYVVLNADLNGVPKNVTGALVPFSAPGGDNLWRLSTCNTIKILFSRTKCLQDKSGNVYNGCCYLHY